MRELYRQAMHWIDGLDRQEWLLVLIAVVIAGFLCLRGMGSRRQY
jgi:hypothetical protein